MRRTVEMLDRLRRALRDADDAAVVKACSELRELGAVERFGAAREAVLASAPKLPDIRTPSRPREDLAAEPGRTRTAAGMLASEATRRKLGRANARSLPRSPPTWPRMATRSRKVNPSTRSAT
jgi:hypothetical protein